ncbi:hypothetical protein PybrP1_002261, partial [[Pythium] brassicae (nom. inval.)]
NPSLTPTSFLLHLRELPSARSAVPPGVLVALYFGRIGSRGASLINVQATISTLVSQARMLDRVRNFVSASKSADPVESPEHVKLTLMMTNRIIGGALAALPGQDSLWWRNLWRAVDLTKFDTLAWATLLASSRSSQPQRNAGPRQERPPPVSS